MPSQMDLKSRYSTTEPTCCSPGGYSPDHEDMPPPISAAADKPLALADSLGQAHDALAALWPDVIPWARALVPAVADMGRRDSGAARLSGSFAPGEPIYLTQGTNSLLRV